MKANRIKATDIKEFAQAFIDSGFNANEMQPIMNLLSHQTPDLKKKFWDIVKAAKAEVTA
jgi:hypothetical protein